MVSVSANVSASLTVGAAKAIMTATAAVRTFESISLELSIPTKETRQSTYSV